ncbi:MAG: 3-isopropylmalate dehydratase small subunit [Pseudomonadota bacterium]
MSIEPFRTLTSRTIVLPEENIDTDQIIPARFLTTTERAGLGAGAFYDWRYDEAGNLRNSSPIEQVKGGQHAILVAGGNFACGSSREHAPWALLDLGFRAVISSDIADIFTSNSLKNGLLPIEVDEKTHDFLINNPGIEISIDLETQIVSPTGVAPVNFTTEKFARRCLLDGVDPLGFLVNQMASIKEYEDVHGR